MVTPFFRVEGKGRIEPKKLSTVGVDNSESCPQVINKAVDNKSNILNIIRNLSDVESLIELVS